MAEVLALLVWVDGDGARKVTRPVPQHDLDAGVVVVPSDSDGPPPGRYVRLSDEWSVVMTPQDPCPVLLKDSHEAQEVSWVRDFDDQNLEVETADYVHRKVRDAVDAKIAQDGVVPISPGNTYATGHAGGYRMHGICIVARRK